MADDIRFKHPFTSIVSGPLGSGKSSFTLRPVQHVDFLCTEPNFSGVIIWCYSEMSAVPHRIWPLYIRTSVFTRAYHRILVMTTVDRVS